MSIVLAQEFVSSNEAYIKWTVNSSLISSSTKGFLYLTDVTQNSSNEAVANPFPIIKYQLRFSELLSGSHIFEDLTIGNYISEINIINGTTSTTSDPLSVQVFYLAKPEVSTIIPGSTKFTITLVAPTSSVQTVTFILLGKLIRSGVTQGAVTNTETVVFPYSADNTYVINGVVNNNEYELACFYTSSNGISSIISDTLVATPTNSPNQITTLSAIYNSVAQTFTITHNMPNNAADFDLVDLRATITDSNNNVTYYYSSENSALLSPAPSPVDNIVFNMNNQTLLPTDLLFTVTLSVKNELNIWGPVESPTIYCVHPLDYFAVALLNTDLSFNVGLNSIDITDNLTYLKNATYIINYTAEVFNSDDQGVIIGDAIALKTQTNLNFNFDELVTGSLYKVVFNLTYTFSFPNSMAVIIQQNVQNACFYYFIPHNTPNQLSLNATPDDQQVHVNWPAISTQDLRGFLLDHYEVSSDNVSWVNKATTTNHTFITLNNGTSYTFYARAVSVSGTIYYNSGSTFNGATASVIAIPYGSPDTPVFNGSVPGDTTSTVNWELSFASDSYNGGLFNTYQASVNSGEYFDIIPTITDMLFQKKMYVYEFNNLTNLLANSIRIKLVTNNQPATNNIDTVKSSNFIVTTIPFSIPSTPTGLVISPDTNSVVLNWNAVLPEEIIDNDVEYEMYYKLASDNDYTIRSNITTNTTTVTGLTSNLVYDFKIRSTVFNSESNLTFNSEFTSVYTGRPFIYSNAPVMELIAGHNTITAKLSPNTSNFFQTTFKYHATITEMDGSNPANISINNVTNSSVQSIVFTVLGDNSSLVDLTLYKIVAYYEMLNTDNSLYYSSNTTTNQIEPYNGALAPVLSSVSGNQVADLTWDVSAFVGYSITDYQLSFDNVSWAVIDPLTISQISLNVLTASISLDQNSVVLQNGQSYNFYIRALLLQNGEAILSSVSNMVTNIPYTNPEIPTNIQTVPGDQQITLSWSAPSNLGGLGLHHYEVKHSGISDWIDVGTELSHPFLNLTNGTTYICYIRTVTIDVLENNTLIYSSSTSNSNVPYKSALAPNSRGLGQANAFVIYHWTISDLGGLTIYRFEVSRNNISWTSNGMGGTSAIYELTNGIPAPIYVRTVTTHPYLGDIIGATYIPIPQIPYAAASAPIFNTCDQGDSQLLFAWTVPSSLGGLLLNHYEVSLNNVDWINAHASVSYLFTGLTNGSNYTLYARAVTTHPNLGLIIGATFTSSVFVPYKLPSAPTLNTINSEGYCVFNLDSNLFGLPLAYYEFSFDNGQFTNDFTQVTATVGINPINFGLFLTYGTTYSFQFRSRSTHPNLGSITGDTFNINFIPYNSVRINLKSPAASSVPSSEQVILNWNAVPVENYGGLQLDHYAVGIGPDTGSVNWINVGSELSHTFAELTNGQDYTFVIKSVFYRQYDPVSVYKSSSNTVVQNMPYAIPAAPTNMTAIPGVGNETVNFAWDNADPVIGGLSFRNYQVSTDNIIWRGYVGFANINTGSVFSVTGPVGVAIPLYARIVTTHPYLVSIFGQSSSASNIPYGIPPITGNYITTPSDGQIIFSWDPASSVDLQGLPLDHYEVSIDRGTTWAVSDTTPSYTIIVPNGVNNYALLSRTVTVHPDPTVGLVYGLHNIYTFAYDAAHKPADALANVVATPGNNSLTISWTKFTWDDIRLNGGNPGGYRVSIDQVNWITLGAGLNNYIFTGLTNGQSYTASVAGITSITYAHNYNNPLQRLVIGASSQVTNIPYRVAAAPALISNPGSQQIELSWNTPDLGSLLIDHYEISYDNGSTWSNLASNSLFVTSPSSSSVTFNSLNNGTTYTYYIKAITTHPILGLIVGTSSNISIVPFLKPGSVTNIIASAINGSMAFSFIPPADVNNNILTQYYEYSIDNFVTINPLFQFTSLTIPINEDPFSLSVRSYILNPNDNVTHVSGDYTTLSNLQNINITTPQNLQAIVGNEFVTLSWTMVSGITFQVRKYLADGSFTKTLVTTSSYTFSGLTNGTLYNFGVCMIANGQPGPVSNISATPMTTPIINSVTKSGDLLLLNINFGGGSSINIDFGAFVIIDNAINGTNRSTIVAYSPTVNPISFSDMSNYNYFNITISNVIGSTSGSFAT